ncbi:4F2 cell-surface antigen heavy chain-like [Eublepharis macularius]|uniref:4F2 cell-surface antigen heavy chain-like n=1 Tax=Eublepharis macularius TaxID=481883 RepID=A0AA97KFL9_EUBMA|nr:4F2 cell-surface antigen heavy chain-like [Eublepharis macularius]
MGKAEAMDACQVPSERLPLLCQAAPSPTYLSQEEVVQQASAAPWQGLRQVLLCLLGALFACMLATALLLLVTMPRPPPPLAWWQKASFYHLPPTAFPDSNGDGHGDLRGVRPLLDRLLELPVQALVLGSILEGDSANLSRICSAHGSLEQLRALVNDGHKQGIRILLELPTWAEGPDMDAEDNRTEQHLKRALQFWQAQGVNGFLVAKDPAWRLDAVLNSWSDLGRQSGMNQGEERVLMVWDQSETCNISRRVPSRVILTCNLPGPERNLTAGALTQQVEAALQYPRGPWPGWTVPRGLLLTADLAETLGVLLFSLPGTPLLQGGAGSPILLGSTMKPSTNGHPLTTLYQSLLLLHARSFALQGASFAPLPLPGHLEDIFAFLRPGSCSGILVVLNLGSQPCPLNLSQLSFPTRAKVLFSTHPEPQSEVKMEGVGLAPHQALLLRVH